MFCRRDGIDAGFSRSSISQRFGGALAPASSRGRSGDDDLPLREPLHERRAKYDAVRARQTAADDDNEDVLPGGAYAVQDHEHLSSLDTLAQAHMKAASHTPVPSLPRWLAGAYLLHQSGKQFEELALCR